LSLFWLAALALQFVMSDEYRYRSRCGEATRVAASDAGALLSQPTTMHDFASRLIKKNQVF
jgi:hypothetical protein